MQIHQALLCLSSDLSWHHIFIAHATHQQRWHRERWSLLWSEHSVELGYTSRFRFFVLVFVKLSNLWKFSRKWTERNQVINVIKVRQACPCLLAFLPLWKFHPFRIAGTLTRSHPRPMVEMQSAKEICGGYRKLEMTFWGGLRGEKANRTARDWWFYQKRWWTEKETGRNRGGGHLRSLKLQRRPCLCTWDVLFHSISTVSKEANVRLTAWEAVWILHFQSNALVYNIIILISYCLLYSKTEGPILS